MTEARTMATGSNHRRHVRRRRSSTSARGRMFEFLKRDHRSILGMLERLFLSPHESAERRAEQFARFRDELDAHSRAEEAVLYARLERVPATRQYIFASIEQHHVVTVLL